MPPSPQSVATAIRTAGPMFDRAFVAAPATTKFNGRTYARSKATTPEAKAFYLAAVALSNPSAISRLSLARYDAYGFDARGAYFLDADPSAMNEARQVQIKAAGEVTRIQGQIKNAQKQLARAEAENQKCGSVDALNILTLGVNGAICGAQWRGQIRHWTDQKLELEAALTDAQAAKRQADGMFAEAKRAYDAENRQLRLQEEQAQQQAAADAAYAQQSAARQAQAESAAASYSDPYSGDAYSSDEYSSEADVSYYADAMDVHGSAELALDFLDLTEDGEAFSAATAFESETVAHNLDVDPGPWGFSRYYFGCDACEMKQRAERANATVFGADPEIEVSAPASGPSALPAGFGQSLAGLAPGSFNSSVSTAPQVDILGLILSAILAIAPIILSVFLPNAPPPESIAPAVAQATGVQTVLDEHAERTGAAAKPDLAGPVLLGVAALKLLGAF
jgi:peptidoglycan hydrolase CwlO-like protein